MISYWRNVSLLVCQVRWSLTKGCISWRMTVVTAGHTAVWKPLCRRSLHFISRRPRNGQRYTQTDTLFFLPFSFMVSVLHLSLHTLIKRPLGRWASSSNVIGSWSVNVNGLCYLRFLAGVFRAVKKDLCWLHQESLSARKTLQSTKLPVLFFFYQMVIYFSYLNSSLLMH